jgi:hypothetical protein
MSRVTTIVIGAVVGVLGLAATIGPAAAARTIEEPSYEVVREIEGLEVRAYAKRVIAQTRVAGDAKTASSAGFEILARYIFGGNEGRASIAMTAPVGQVREGETIEMTAPVGQRKDPEDEDRWVVTFTMPAAYTLETLPKPLDARVELRELPARHVVVWRFSGAPRPAVVEQRKRQLVERVEAAGLVATGEVEYARYDPPWVLPLLRRNELWVEIADPTPTPKR